MEPNNKEGCVQLRCGVQRGEDVIKHEVQAKEPEKIKFELKEEESDSTTEEESEDEEAQTPGVIRSIREIRKPKRYSPSTFYSDFSLSITDDHPKRPWLMKWNLCTKMRLGIWWSYRSEGNPLV